MRVSFVGGIVGVVVAAVTLVAPFTTSHAAALPRSAGRGYFTNSAGGGWGQSIISNNGVGIPSSAYTKAGFISYIKSNLSSTTRNKTGAQFIIQLMRGSPYDYGRPTSSDITDWENRLNQSSITVSVAYVNYTWDSAYDSGINDDYFFQQASRTDQALVFRDNGKVVFTIRLACANPIGDLPGLPPVPPPDVCPNIAGAQATIPAGMVKDASGNCVAANRPPTGRASGGSCASPSIAVSSLSDPDHSPDYATIAVNGSLKPTRYYNGATINVASYVGWQRATITVYAMNLTNTGAESGPNTPIYTVAIGPCASLGCQPMSTSPDNIEPNSSYTFTVGVTASSAPPAGGTMTAVVTGPGGTKTYTTPATLSYSSYGTNVTARSGSTTVSTAGLYGIRWTFTVGSGASLVTKTCGGTMSSTDSFRVAYYPIFHVTGGDISTGASFGSVAKPCSTGGSGTNPLAGIVGWNDGSPTFNGAGDWYAAFAMSHLQDFVTHQGVGGGTGTGSLLSVTNDPAALGNGSSYTYFGGMFDSAPCMDYWGAKPASTKPFTALSNTNGDYYAASNVTIGSASITPGTHTTLYVNGNVQINTDISLGDSWASWNSIPSLRIVAKGNIYIAPTVSRLDGVYVAVPGFTGAAVDPATGIVSTCGTGYNSVLVTSATFYSTCNHRLTVNGSFAANQVHLLRSAGSLHANDPAETFNYGPQTWMGSGGTYQDLYQSVLGLPPVL